ncbi:MAG: hypothetical protein AB7U75_03025 [Hyphomicrobiaceae bacterium]
MSADALTLRLDILHGSTVYPPIRGKESVAMRFISLFCASLFFSGALFTANAISSPTSMQPALTAPSGGFVLVAAKGGSATNACIKKCKSNYICGSVNPSEKPTCKSNLRNCIAACKK